MDTRAESIFIAISRAKAVPASFVQLAANKRASATGFPRRARVTATAVVFVNALTTNTELPLSGQR